MLTFLWSEWSVPTGARSAGLPPTSEQTRQTERGAQVKITAIYNRARSTWGINMISAAADKERRSSWRRSTSRVSSSIFRRWLRDTSLRGIFLDIFVRNLFRQILFSFIEFWQISGEKKRLEHFWPERRLHPFCPETKISFSFDSFLICCYIQKMAGQNVGLIC